MADIDTSLYPDRLRGLGIPGLDKARSVERVPVDEVTLVESVDIREMCRSAVPGLVRKAVRMAAGSDSLREVLDVLREVSDRGYGKAVASVEVKVTTRDEGLGAIRELIEAGVLDAAGAKEAAREIGLEWIEAEVVTQGEVASQGAASQELADV